MKKLFVCVLAVCILLPVLAACNGSAPKNDTKDGGIASGDSVATDTGSETTGDTLPGTSDTSGGTSPGTSDSSGGTPTNPDDSFLDALGDHDFQGAEFKIISRAAATKDFQGVGQGGTPVERAVYVRNEAVANRFNVKLTVNSVSGDQRNDLYNMYYGLSLSDTHGVSLVTGNLNFSADMSVRGFTYDLNTLSSLALTEAWWGETFYESCVMGNKLFVAVGDVTHSIYDSAEVIFFNEALAATYVKDQGGTPIDLYGAVRSGAWSWEAFVNCTLSVPYSQTGTVYGLVTDENGAKALPQGMGVTVSQKQSDGRFLFGTTNDSHIRYDNIVAFFNGNDQVRYPVNEADSETVGNALFTAGQAVFYTQRLSAASTLRAGMGEGQTLGVLPYPKYDTAQQGYRTPLREDVTAMTVPKNVKNTEMVGLVTEALARYGYETVRPECWNTAFEGYTADAEISEQLGRIRGGMTVSFEVLYSYNIGDVYSVVPTMISENQTFAQYYQGKASGWNGEIRFLYSGLGVTS